MEVPRFKHEKTQNGIELEGKTELTGYKINTKDKAPYYQCRL